MDTHYERRGWAVYGPDSGPGTAKHVCECASILDAERLLVELNDIANESANLRLELASCHRELDDLRRVKGF